MTTGRINQIIHTQWDRSLKVSHGRSYRMNQATCAFNLFVNSIPLGRNHRICSACICTYIPPLSFSWSVILIGSCLPCSSCSLASSLPLSLPPLLPPSSSYICTMLNIRMITVKPSSAGLADVQDKSVGLSLERASHQATNMNDLLGLSVVARASPFQKTLMDSTRNQIVQ